MISKPLSRAQAYSALLAYMAAVLFYQKISPHSWNNINKAYIIRI